MSCLKHPCLTLNRLQGLFLVLVFRLVGDCLYRDAIPGPLGMVVADNSKALGADSALARAARLQGLKVQC